jgi:hypothetical protein
MSSQSLSAVCNELDAIVVARIEGRDVTRRELSAAFDWVADRSNWKNPIDVRLVLSDRQCALVAAAVEFFAGCRPTIERDGDVVHVRAVGYYVAVGA